MGRRGSGGGFRSAPRARAPAPAKPSAAPPPAPRSNGGLMTGGSFVSNVVEGLTWGAGISLGHRIVDFFSGPRTIRVTEVPSQASASAPVSDVCDIHNKAFADCISHNGSDISRCQFYVDMLNQCRRGSHADIAAATTIA